MKTRPGRGGPQSTITNDTHRPPSVGVDPIVALWVPAIPHDVMLPRDLEFRIGREGTGAVINHHFVSRHHADAVREGNALHITNRSKNRIEYDGVLIDDFTIKPGEMMKLDQVEVFTLTRSMLAARQALAFSLGYGPEARTMPLIQAAARGRSFVVAGPPGSPRYEVACALIEASPRREARRREVIAGQVPSGEAIREVAAKNGGGVVYVDGDAVESMPVRDSAALAGFLGNPAWNLTVVWSCATFADPARLFGDERFAAMQQVQVPMVAARFKRRHELDLMVDYLGASIAVGLRAGDLSPSIVDGMKAYAWPYNHRELRMCVEYLAHRRNKASVESVAQMLGHGPDGTPLNRDRLRTLARHWGAGS